MGDTKNKMVENPEESVDRQESIDTIEKQESLNAVAQEKTSHTTF